MKTYQDELEHIVYNLDKHLYYSNKEVMQYLRLTKQMNTLKKWYNEPFDFRILVQATEELEMVVHNTPYDKTTKKYPLYTFKFLYPKLDLDDMLPPPLVVAVNKLKKIKMEGELNKQPQPPE